ATWSSSDTSSRSLRARSADGWRGSPWVPGRSCPAGTSPQPRPPAGCCVGTRRLLKRCAALVCLLTAFGFFVNGMAGVLLLARVPDGPHDLSHTVLPILVSIGVLSFAVLVVVAARRLGGGAPRFVRAVAAGLEGAWREVGTPHWRLLGAAGFLCLDMGALWAACAATGHRIGFLAVVIAYCIGYLATVVPMPAGLGVLDSGLAASLVLYGLSPAASVGAV